MLTSFEVSAASPAQIYSFSRIELFAALANNGPALVRSQEKPDMLLVREDLKNAMDQASITGLIYSDTKTFSSFKNS